MDNKPNNEYDPEKSYMENWKDNVGDEGDWFAYWLQIGFWAVVLIVIIAIAI